MQMLLIGRFLNAGRRHFDTKPIGKTSGLLFPFIKSLVIFTDHSDILKVKSTSCKMLRFISIHAVPSF